MGFVELTSENLRVVLSLDSRSVTGKAFAGEVRMGAAATSKMLRTIVCEEWGMSEDEVLQQGW
jgi:hypothetical protein